MLGSPVSMGFLRPPKATSPRLLPPEPRDETELEELGFSFWFCAEGKEGRWYGGISSAAAGREGTELAFGTYLQNNFDI